MLTSLVIAAATVGILGIVTVLIEEIVRKEPNAPSSRSSSNDARD